LAWSVRRLEKEVRNLKNNVAATPEQEHHDVTILQNHLSEQLGAPVEITGEGNKGGWLKIKFYDNDTLTGLLERLDINHE
jgi:ParB family chromosome partitioning protein